MKVETDAVLVVFWMWAEMVLRWCRPSNPSTLKKISHRAIVSKSMRRNGSIMCTWEDSIDWSDSR